MTFRTYIIIRYQLPKFVMPSYVMAFGYCSLDAISAGHREWTKENDKHIEKMHSTRGREVNAALAAFDTLLWQTFASVLIPGGVINMVVRVSRFTVGKTALSPAIQKWLPTGVGIGSIPLIIHPIDSLVDYAMDNSTRKWMFPEKKKVD